jgi:hypothetical protein
MATSLGSRLRRRSARIAVLRERELVAATLVEAVTTSARRVMVSSHEPTLPTRSPQVGESLPILLGADLAAGVALREDLLRADMAPAATDEEVSLVTVRSPRCRHRRAGHNALREELRRPPAGGDGSPSGPTSRATVDATLDP